MISHPTRLLWQPGRGGYAKLDGAMTTLTLPPKINGREVYAIEYLPMGDSIIATVQESPCEGVRDLTADEIRMVRLFLAKMCGG